MVSSFAGFSRIVFPVTGDSSLYTVIYIYFKEVFLIWILQLHKIRNPADLYSEYEKLERFTRPLERQCMELGNFKEAYL
jgi:hypothetical protein